MPASSRYRTKENIYSFIQLYQVESIFAHCIQESDPVEGVVNSDLVVPLGAVSRPPPPSVPLNASGAAPSVYEASILFAWTPL